jgi:potassium-transporting ATPase KdpC subunit
LYNGAKSLKTSNSHSFITAILRDFRLHFCCLLLFGFAFPLLIKGIALFFPQQASGLPIYRDNNLVGFANIGQKFVSDKYFWGRPSAVNYNAASTGGSNLGPTNPAFLAQVEQRIQHFMELNPQVKRSEIPSELVTASGSGLDPHISPPAALIQVARVAASRNMPPGQIMALVNSHIEKPLIGIFGTTRVNVLKLNLALDQLSANNSGK